MQAERIAAAARLAVAEKDRDMQRGANDAQGGCNGERVGVCVKCM
jgi:hypothetical protein